MKTLTFRKKMFLMITTAALAATALLANNPVPQPDGPCDQYMCDYYGACGGCK